MDLVQIEKKVWEALKHEMTWGGATLKKNDKALFITFKTVSHMNGLAVKKLMNSLRGVGSFIDNDCLVLAPVDTAEQKVSLAEIKASLVGTRVLKHQEKMIELLAGFKDSLLELKNMKDTLKMEQGEVCESV